tara:strand:+ start:88 stop:303 length:216 start_codon:yes stop_codon:yes gene_type:complete
MMRINREKNTLKTSVKNHCANYDTGYNCIGVMIDKELNQYVDSDFCNKPCKIANGDDCKYYDNIVRKIAGF